MYPRALSLGFLILAWSTLSPVAVVANNGFDLSDGNDIQGWEFLTNNGISTAMDAPAFSSEPRNLSVNISGHYPKAPPQEPPSGARSTKHRKCPAKYQATPPVGNSGILMCGTLSYSPTTHFCENGQVCHVGDTVCGKTCITSEYKCVDPSTNKYVLRGNGK